MQEIDKGAELDQGKINPDTGQKARYGFYDRLKSEFPSQLLVDASELCNLACIHCPHPTFKKSEHYDKRLLPKELNEKLVDEVKQHGQGFTQYIRYASNGEPLTHPDIFEMMEYAKKHSGVTVTLTTNGKTLDEKKAERLLDMGLDLVDISLDAYKDETYAAIRVQGDLKITRRNVQNLIKRSKERGGKTKVVVSYVEQPLNIEETQSFKKYWEDEGADYVVVRRLHSCSGAKESLAVLEREINKGAERRPCLYPWERIVLNARGDLSFCPSDWVHGSYIADYRNTTIYETWHGEFYKQLREAHLSNNYAKHAFCGQCPDWINTRWPDEGRSYANMVQDFKETE